MPIRDANSRPVRRTGYSFANQGAAAASNTGASVGKHVLRRMPGVDYWGPSWGDETVIRCFPSMSPDGSGQFDPFRLSDSYCDFGDWVRVYEAVRNFGNPGVTMLLHDGLDPAYDAQLMNPCWILYRAINQALSQGQGLTEWIPLTKGGQGRGAQLAKPSKLYLVQCAIFRHKGKDTFGQNRPPLGTAPDGPTIVMGLPPTAGEALIQMLEERVEDWKGDPDDPSRYKYGDVVGIDDGGFIHIYELGKDPRARFSAQRQAASPASIYTASAKSAGGAGMEAKGYGIFITKTLDGSVEDISSSLTGLDDMIKSKLKPWDQILEFKSDEEQARLVAPLFPPSAVLYAWRDHPSWIPDSVREAGAFEARQPVSVSPPPVTAAGPWMRQRSAPTPAPTPTPPAQEDDYAEDQGDVQGDYQVENLSTDPLMDDSAKIAAAKAKLDAATKRFTKK